MRKKFLFLLSALCVFTMLAAQQNSYYFYIQLNNKNNSPFSLANPAQYLSQRAIDHRNAQNISIDSTDLPVNTQYINAIRTAGANIFAVSKWLNGVTVLVSDSAATIPVIRVLPFVKFVEYTGLQSPIVQNIPNLNKKNILETANQADIHGAAAAQIKQLKGDYLHNLGYRGRNIQIAVIDGGYISADVHAAFDSLRADGRILGTHNFGQPSVSVYTGISHGAAVLSTMAANAPQTYIGTAPDAAYWLLVSEKNNSEYPVEADLWMSAAEFADSAGVDVITTSLGYAVFDDATLNYKYSELDGKTIRASRAATLAAKKGILTFNAAGNEGASAWHHINVPADADKIITVGAVDSTGASASFSSFGPAADGRIKPEVSAIGSHSAVLNANNSTDFTFSNGTSFATPIMAGVSACLLQALKENNININIPQIIENICKSASLYNNPTTQQGYGIPDFQKVLGYFNIMPPTKISDICSNSLNISNNGNEFIVKFNDNQLPANLKIFSTLGQLIYSQTVNADEIRLQKSDLQRGILILQITGKNFTNVGKIVNYGVLPR